MNDEVINKRYITIEPVKLNYMVHALWTSGEHAGECRSWDVTSRRSAVLTMNNLLESGVCAWVTEVQDENR